MRRRPLGAVADFKRKVKAIRRARARGELVDDMAQRMVPQRNTQGEWHVWLGRQHRAGPFDTRDEAVEWIAANA